MESGPSQRSIMGDDIGGSGQPVLAAVHLRERCRAVDGCPDAPLLWQQTGWATRRRVWLDRCRRLRLRAGRNSRSVSQSFQWNGVAIDDGDRRGLVRGETRRSGEDEMRFRTSAVSGLPISSKSRAPSPMITGMLETGYQTTLPNPRRPVKAGLISSQSEWEAESSGVPTETRRRAVAAMVPE